jgi:hypothetical protein
MLRAMLHVDFSTSPIYLLFLSYGQSSRWPLKEVSSEPQRSSESQPRPSIASRTGPYSPEEINNLIYYQKKYNIHSSVVVI